MNTITTNMYMQDRRTPREWGFQDAIAGKSEFEGYDLFAGESLIAYIDGHHTGQCYSRMYAAKLPHLSMPPVVARRVRRVVLAEVRKMAGGSEPYAPFSDPALSQVNGRMEDEIGYSESTQPYLY